MSKKNRKKVLPVAATTVAITATGVAFGPDVLADEVTNILPAESGLETSAVVSKPAEENQALAAEVAEKEAEISATETELSATKVELAAAENAITDAALQAQEDRVAELSSEIEATKAEIAESEVAPLPPVEPLTQVEPTSVPADANKAIVSDPAAASEDPVLDTKADEGQPTSPMMEEASEVPSGPVGTDRAAGATSPDLSQSVFNTTTDNFIRLERSEDAFPAWTKDSESEKMAALNEYVTAEFGSSGDYSHIEDFFGKVFKHVDEQFYNDSGMSKWYSLDSRGEFWLRRDAKIDNYFTEVPAEKSVFIPVEALRNVDDSNPEVMAKALSTLPEWLLSGRIPRGIQEYLQSPEGSKLIGKKWGSCSVNPKI